MNLTNKRKQVLDYLNSLKTQKKILSGQYGFYGEQTSPASGQEQLQKIFNIAGRWPALTGADFKRPDKTLDQSINDAVTWLTQKWNEGMLVNISWHSDNPSGGDKMNEWPKPPYDMKRILPGGDSHNAWVQMLDKAAAGLKKMEDAGVVVIWRPFHEMNGAWFWWHQNPVDVFVSAWKYMHDYFTKTKKLTNLIWAYSPNEQWDQWAASVAKYYPGSEYVDIVGIDYYRSKGAPIDQINDRGEYDWLRSTGKPVMLLEFGPIPASGDGWNTEKFNWKTQFLDVLVSKYPEIVGFQAWEWVFQMAGSNYTGVKEVLIDDRVISRDELPKWTDSPPIDEPPDEDPPGKEEPPITTNPIPADWRTRLVTDDWMRKEIALAEHYAEDAFGTDGHGRLMTINRLVQIIEQHKAP